MRLEFRSAPTGRKGILGTAFPGFHPGLGSRRLSGRRSGAGILVSHPFRKVREMDGARGRLGR